MPLIETKGAASAQGFGEFAKTGEAVYIESCFSTWLYTGNGSTQTITNGIDLSTKGGLVWMKARSSALSNFLCDTARGRAYYLYSDWNGAQQGPSASNRDLTSFNTDGFSLGQNANADINTNAVTFASWTFRKQPKFFDVVTWTGDGTNPRQISHNLGSVPGCIIVKSTTRSENWTVYHRSLGNTGRIALNTTAAAVTGTGVWASTTPTSTTFTVSADNLVNFSGDGYVAYLFAHDAGGFGLTGTDNVISCGSFATDGSGNATVSLGYEPQWVLIKQTDGADNWYLNDNMRGMAVSGNQPNLSPNLSAAEQAGGYNTYPNATGFTASVGIASKNYIYIAIRRGPMKTPTTGTSVYNGITRTGTGANASVTGAGFPPDLALIKQRGASGNASVWNDKLRGTNRELYSNNTDGEFAGSGGLNSFDQNGVSLGNNTGNMNDSGATYINWFMRRAPGFFDEVCYTGNSVTTETQAVTHNLSVAPELIFIKRRDTSSSVGWFAGCSFTASTYGLGWLNLTDSVSPSSYGNPMSARPTATTFSVGPNTNVNANASTYVAYLFASCPGVSKVFSFTGNGSSQTINCGFTGGSRLVLIKRTDSTGNWVIFDSARGIVAGNDSALYLNSTAAEVTGVDAIDTDSTGFIVNQETTFNLNVNNATYIGLAIA